MTSSFSLYSPFLLVMSLSFWSFIPLIVFKYCCYWFFLVSFFRSWIEIFVMLPANIFMIFVYHVYITYFFLISKHSYSIHYFLTSDKSPIPTDMIVLRQNHMEKNDSFANFQEFISLSLSNYFVSLQNMKMLLLYLWLVLFCLFLFFGKILLTF